MRLKSARPQLTGIGSHTCVTGAHAGGEGRKGVRDEAGGFGSERTLAKGAHAPPKPFPSLAKHVQHNQVHGVGGRCALGRQYLIAKVVCLTIGRSVREVVHRSTFLSLSFSQSLPACLSVHLFACLSICSLVCPSVRLSVHLFACRRRCAR